MKWIGVIVCVLFLSACSLSPIPVPQESTYTITQWPHSMKNAKRSRTAKTILVTNPIAASGYNSSKMIYVLIPYQLQAYADNRWVAPPSSLLLPLIANRLRATNYFKAVVETPFSGNANYQLNTQLLVLQQEFLQPISRVRLVMEATLINEGTSQVVASRVFQAVEPAPQNNPYSGVLATNKAANKVVNGIAKWAISRAR